MKTHQQLRNELFATSVSNSLSLVFFPSQSVPTKTVNLTISAYVTKGVCVCDATIQVLSLRSDFEDMGPSTAEGREYSHKHTRT